MEILGKLPVDLKYELLVSMYPELILDCPFFNNFDISFIVRMIPLLHPVEFLPGEFIWRTGQYSSSVFFLVKGKASFMLEPIKPSTGTAGKSHRNIYHKLNQQHNANIHSRNEDETLKSYIQNEESMVLFKMMTNGSYFGETDLILRRRRGHTIVAASKCDMYIINRTVN